jgi:hypothetical protein
MDLEASRLEPILMASVRTFEGTVENGQIRLRDNVILPEKATVYVVVPEMLPEQPAQIWSPRLAHPAEAKDFSKVVLEAEGDARL